MEDKKIIELFFQRNEEAISAVKEKYGRLFSKIAENILGSASDAEECVSDGLFKLWNEIPPANPERLGAFGAKVVRNLSLDALRRENALRRGGGRSAECLEELDEVLPGDGGDFAESIALKDSLNSFLSGLSYDSRRIFMKRYWYMQSISEIARETGFSESKVKMSLLRTRNALKSHLEKEETV
ncbi:MAG: sigma-70 family RNA polymerase sigma factor [Clostridia bacterium]|nr:sigma-70 family RNA polymerase sigma factor [Clostridia bacterium]